MLPAVALAVATALSTGARAQDEVVLLNDQPSGAIELTGQSRFEVRGVVGTIFVRAGKPGLVRYGVRARTSRREDHPIGLWYEGRTLRLSPLPDLPEQPLIVEVALSPELALRIDAVDSTVKVSGVGGVEVRGAGLELDVRALRGSAEIDVTNATITVDRVPEGLSLIGSGLDAQVANVEGGVSFELDESRIGLENVTGSIDGDLQESDLTAITLRGELSLSAYGGQVDLRDLGRQSLLNLDETSVAVAATSGAIEIETNAPVQFRDLEGLLKIQSYGGSISGIGAGDVELRTDDATVVLENLGTVVLRGVELEAKLKGINGDVTIEAASSRLIVQDAKGAVTVENDFGDVEIYNAGQAVSVVSRDGDVLVSGLRAPLQLRADGERVEIRWIQVPLEGDSYIENENGEVWLNLPNTARGRLQIESRFGRVESSVGTVRISDDGSSAAGVLGRSEKPLIDVKSGGNVYVGVARARVGGE
jgi:DUF4097 and DUF4098 domain-containing protein YvlB